MRDKPEVGSAQEAHNNIVTFAVLLFLRCCWYRIVDVSDRAGIARTTTTALVVLPVDVVGDDDGGEEDDDGDIVDDDK